MRRPLAPSTSLTAVLAATTPSSPGLNESEPASVTTFSLRRVGVSPGAGVHVHVQPHRRHSLPDLLLNLQRDVVRALQRGGWRAVDVQHGDELAPHPAGAHVMHAENSLHARGRG